MKRLRAVLLASALFGVVALVLLCGCITQEYTVNVNADRSGTVNVKVVMNNTTYEALGSLWGSCMAPKNTLQYIGDKYFPGFVQTKFNQTISGVIYVNLVYTKNAANLDTVDKIDLSVSGNQLIFIDQRFVTLVDILSADACLPVDAPNVTVEYQLTMPYTITSYNGDTKSGNVAHWTFTLKEKQNINARCNLPATTTATTTTVTTTATTTTATTCPDSDGDGWNDCQETAAGTNPNSPDTDNDGIWDPLDPNPLVPAGTATTTATTTITTPQRTPAPAMLAAAAALGAAAVLLASKRR